MGIFSPKCIMKKISDRLKFKTDGKGGNCLLPPPGFKGLQPATNTATGIVSGLVPASYQSGIHEILTDCEISATHYVILTSSVLNTKSMIHNS